MELAAREDKLATLARLKAEAEQLAERINDLETELGQAHTEPDWRDREYYLTYYATTGFFLGMVGAFTSLLFNVIGSLGVGQHPLKLIQIYLTFGIGSRAIDEQFNDGLALLVGCCLYVATGMAYGVLFQIFMSQVAPKSDLIVRLSWASLLGIVLWIVNYYGILIWLQPLLFGGNWIVEQVPWYVGAGTHLVFAWTMAVLYPYGVFSPYRIQTEQ